MMSLPDSTAGISTTTNTRGVAIGPGFATPEGRLHVRDGVNDGTVLLLEAQSSQLGNIDGTFTNRSPDYFIKARFDNHLIAGPGDIQFSVDAGGKIQSGFYSTSVIDQLAVTNNMAIYRGTNQKLRFELSNNEPRFIWKSPGNNFQFVNQDQATIALQLGEGGQVGINTGNFQSTHKLFVDGSSLLDRIFIQDESNWGVSDEYVGIDYLPSGPQLRWKSDDANLAFVSETTSEVPLRLSPEGKVGINTDNFENSDHSLYIAGSSVAEEMFVKLSDDWGDFVFEKDYDLMPLEELDDYLNVNKHLPGFPTAAEIEKDGLALGETERLLTIKVEELTLYILELKKEIDTLRQELEKE